MRNGFLRPVNEIFHFPERPVFEQIFEYRIIGESRRWRPYYGIGKHLLVKKPGLYICHYF